MSSGEFTFQIKVKPDFTAHIRVLAYVVLGCHKVLAHSAKFHTENCFRNKVSGRYSQCDVQTLQYWLICVQYKVCPFLANWTKLIDNKI